MENSSYSLTDKDIKIKNDWLIAALIIGIAYPLSLILGDLFFSDVVIDLGYAIEKTIYLVLRISLVSLFYLFAYKRHGTSLLICYFFISILYLIAYAKNPEFSELSKLLATWSKVPDIICFIWVYLQNLRLWSLNKKIQSFRPVFKEVEKVEVQKNPPTKLNTTTLLIKKLWMSILSISILVFFGFFLFRPYCMYFSPSQGAIGRKIGLAIGNCLVEATLGFFIFFFIRKRLKKGNLEFWLFCFAISFSLYTISRHTQTIKNLKALDKISQGVVRFQQEDSTQESLKSYSRSEYGDFAPFLTSKQEFKSSELNIFVELQTAISKLENTFIPETVCNYEHLIQSKKELETALYKLNDSENRLKIASSRFETQVTACHFDDDGLKELFLIGFSENKNISDALAGNYFDIVRRSILKFNEFANFLSEVHGSYWISENRLVFQEGKDVETFNQLIQDISDLGQEEDILLNRLKEYLDPTFRKEESNNSL
ncbi:MAG: hypothetical protein HKM07_06750 [Chlamydiae bacterium]|nr:hypothetical protein [Chlamydiota bacterium]